LVLGTGKFRSYLSDAANPGSLNDNWIRSIYESRAGVIWFGTTSGLNRYRRETDDFVTYQNDPANPYSLTDGVILSVLEDVNEQLWVGGMKGLNKFNQKMGRFVNFRHDPNDPNSLSNDEILSIYQDSRDVVWVGTRMSGQRGGLNRYDLATGRFEVVKDLGEALVYTMFEDREGQLWLGTYDALYKFESDTNTFKKYGWDPARPSLPSIVIAITEDSSGNLLVATVGDGMGILDKEAGVLRHYELGAVSPVRAGKNRVYAILEDQRRQLWVATADGVERIDPATNVHTIHRYDPNDPKSLSANDAGTIHEDANGTIWIGTTSGGLNRFEPETNSFTRFSPKEGLPSADVFGIMEEEEGKRWSCARRGLGGVNMC